MVENLVGTCGKSAVTLSSLDESYDPMTSSCVAPCVKIGKVGSAYRSNSVRNISFLQYEHFPLPAQCVFFDVQQDITLISLG